MPISRGKYEQIGSKRLGQMLSFHHTRRLSSQLDKHDYYIDWYYPNGLKKKKVPHSLTNTNTT